MTLSIFGKKEQRPVSEHPAIAAARRAQEYEADEAGVVAVKSALTLPPPAKPPAPAVRPQIPPAPAPPAELKDAFSLWTNTPEYVRHISVAAYDSLELTAEQEKEFADARDAFAKVVEAWLPVGAEMVFSVRRRVKPTKGNGHVA